MERSVYTREERGWGTELELFTDLFEAEEVPDLYLDDIPTAAPFAPCNSKFAIECGVTLYFAVCIEAMIDSFGDPNDDDVMDIREWCLTELPEIWSGMTSGSAVRITTWLEAMWAHTDLDETARCGIIKLLKTVRNKQGSNQNMQRRNEDGEYT
jgi:hypothetical protein